MANLMHQAIEAEQSLIGAILLTGAATWDSVADLVTERDLFRHEHRLIWRAIEKIVAAGGEADVITVFEHLTAAGHAEAVGGIAYLAELANQTPGGSNARGYARIIAEKSRLRQLSAAIERINDLAADPSNRPARERIDEAITALTELLDAGNGSEPRAIGEILPEVVSEIHARIERGHEVDGLKTGFTDLDRMLGGMKNGDLVIVAARPSMGKTALALNIAENVALSGKTSLVFSLEMGSRQLAVRAMASIGRIPMQKIHSPTMSEDDLDKIQTAATRLKTARLLIDESSTLTPAQMAARARQVKRRHGLDLVVIDYLQLMVGDGASRNEEVSQISRAMKLMARELDVPVVLLSQLSRKPEERPDKRPILSDLRDSGSIEQDADVVLMLYRDDYYHPETPHRGVTEALIRKNRQGPTGMVPLVFMAEYSRFGDADASVREMLREAREERKPARRKSWPQSVPL